LLKGALTGAPPPTPSAATPSAPNPAEAAKERVGVEVYARAKAGFEAKLDSLRLGLETKGLPKGATPMQIAETWNEQYGKDVMEERLALLYKQASEAAGEAYTETMQLIHMHEIGIGKVTGEDAEAVRL